MEKMLSSPDADPPEELATPSVDPGAGSATSPKSGLGRSRSVARSRTVLNSQIELTTRKANMTMAKIPNAHSGNRGPEEESLLGYFDVMALQLRQ